MENKIKTQILIIGERKENFNTLDLLLQKENIYLTFVSDQKSACKESTSNKYALIIIEIKKQYLGCYLKQLSEFRESSNRIPVILVTDKLKDKEIVQVYNSGTNQIHNKPIRSNILLAQVKRLLKENYNHIRIRVEDIVIDAYCRKFYKAGREITLTPNEYDFVKMIFKNKGRVLSRSYVISNILDCNRDVLGCAVDTMVSRIRKKLGGEKDSVIETVQGRGYRLNPKYLVDQEVIYK